MLQDINEIKKLAIELDIPCSGESSTQQTSAQGWDALRNGMIDVVTQLQVQMEQITEMISSLDARVSQLAQEEKQLGTTVRKLLRESDASYCSPSASETLYFSQASSAFASDSGS